MAKKVSATFAISEELQQECRNTVAFLGGHPLHLNMSQLAEMALREKIETLQREYHHGQPFPYYGGPTKTGRPAIGTKPSIE